MLIQITKLCVTLALFLATTTAQGADRTAEASAKYQSGMAHYRLGEWDAAIDDWQSAFRARPLPEFLFNIAQAYRLSKRPDKALQFYESYLSMSPEAANGDAVRQYIAELRQQLAARPFSATPQSSPPPPPIVTTSPTTSQPTSETVKQPAATLATSSPPPRRKKTWVWGVVAGGAVVVAGAVVLGVVLGTASNESHLPPVRF